MSVKTKKQKAENVDLREQTFNQGHVGPVEIVATAIQQIGQIQKIMFDIDTILLALKGPFSPKGLSPQQFYQRYLLPWLNSHPVLKKAEVRFTGKGFHVLLCLAEPILLPSQELLSRCEGIVQVVQAALPIDVKQPGINALTRPVGSINSKNGKIVKLLRPGEPVSQQEIMSLYEDMSRRPFPTIMQIWFGSDKIEPCPVMHNAAFDLAVINQEMPIA